MESRQAAYDPTCISAKSLNSLAATGHTFEVRAVDAEGNTDATPATFEWMVLTSVQAIQDLIAYIEGLGISGGTKNALLGPLKQATRILTDRYTQNDGAACGKLDEFLTTVDEKEAAGQLTSGQALQLRQAAQAIKVNEGCP